MHVEIPIGLGDATRTHRMGRLGLRLRWLAFLLSLVVVCVVLRRVHAAVQNALTGRAAAATTLGKVLGSTSLRHAQRFSVEYRPDCKIVRVTASNGNATGGTVYQLVPRGHRPMALEPGAILVETPIRRAIALSTTFAQVFAQLGVAEVLVGMTGVKLLNTPELKAQSARGQLAEVGDGTLAMEKKLDMERIRTLAPDLILTSFRGSEGSKLEEAGFAVAEISQWLEPTPLARAEWLKFVATFLDREAEAERVFSEIERRYETMAARARGVTSRPTVMCGSDHRGTWYVPGGQSYVAAFIQDAGGNYLWRSSSGTDSLPLKMEAVLDRAKNADFWLLHMNAIRSRKELSESDSRNALFEAFRAGKVFNNDARVSPGGGNDYWETGVNKPDLVLADLIAILHPELAPEHQFNWYRRLPEEAHP